MFRDCDPPNVYANTAFLGVKDPPSLLSKTSEPIIDSTSQSTIAALQKV